MRNNKGVTLVALVITIIVLLILAGVALAMLTGDSGILTNAENAKSETTTANAKSAIEMAYMDIKTEVYALNAGVTTLKGDDGKAITEMTADIMEKIAEKYCDATKVATGTGTSIKFTYGDTVLGESTITYTKGANPEVSLSLGAEPAN